MKKRNILGLFIVLGFVFISFSVGVASLSAEPAQEEQGNYNAVEQKGQFETVIKTYFLKYIEPDELLNAGKVYILDASAHENTISVTMYKKHVSDFEALLKKLDVEKRTVLLNVFTVIASREDPGEKEVIENRDVKRVLDELESLWKFKSYKMDGPSFLNVRDGSGYNYFKLVSATSNLNMYVVHVRVRGEKPGDRIVNLGQIQLKWADTYGKMEQTLIDSNDVTLKENSYLVVGVSGFNVGGLGKALILIINAEIK